MVAKSLAAPLAAAVIARLVLRRVGGEWSSRYGGVFGMVAGFLAGFVLMNGWDAAVPRRYWHWLGWIAVGCVVVGGSARVTGMRWWDRSMLHAALAGAAAAWLVPGWKELEAVRLWYVAGLVLFFLALMEGLSGAGRWDRGLGVMLAVSAFVVAGLITAGVSVTYGLVALAAAGALAGCVATGIGVEDRGLGTAYGALVGGAAFVGCIEARPALWGLLACAAAPLAVWVGEVTGVGKRPGISGMVARYVPVLVVLIAGAGWVVAVSGMLTGG
jgi:hypothetical protein